jgi:serine/threonine-protein kinase
MVMEYLDGADLDAWLKHLGPLPIVQAVEFVLQASVAVAEAHGLGIVHRDLKPANLFCIRRADGQLVVKVLDFGISKVNALTDAPSDDSLTHTSAVMGSPHYMSPEQLQTPKDVDGRTDIWALGVVLYELLAGNLPFGGQRVTEIAIKIATEEPPSLRSVRADIPPGIERVILKCLAKDRRRRYGHVAELAQALAKFAPVRATASVERIAGLARASGISHARAR